MTSIILYYISQFYPLIIGAIIFVSLKSLNLLKHRIRISLESQINLKEIKYPEELGACDTYNICDLSAERGQHGSAHLYAYTGAVPFGSFITNSAAPRKAAFAMLVNDRLILNGTHARRFSEHKAAYAGASIGIVDIAGGDSSYLNEISNSQRLDLFAPEKETFIRSMLKQNPMSVILLRHVADYNLNIVV